MKVGTDGCLLGGWFDCSHSRRILDIGCGSGLIAIMAAQRCNAYITGIEIDGDAARQAEENASNSPWKERIEIRHCNFLEYSCREPFDTIVSNPPYFINSLKCNNEERTLARHSDSLDSISFFRKSKELLTSDGKVSIIIPCDILSEWDTAAKASGFFKSRITYIKTTPRKPAKRALVEFSLQATTALEETLVFETGQGVYSEEAKKILRDFYLKIE